MPAIDRSLSGCRYAAEPDQSGSAAAAVGVVTQAQQELLDYVEDLYEMAALDLITTEELETRKDAVIAQLEASVLAGIDTPPLGHPHAAPGPVAGQGRRVAVSHSIAAAGGGSADTIGRESATEIRVAGPNSTRLYTQVSYTNIYDKSR